MEILQSNNHQAVKKIPSSMKPRVADYFPWIKYIYNMYLFIIIIWWICPRYCALSIYGTRFDTYPLSDLVTTNTLIIYIYIIVCVCVCVVLQLLKQNCSLSDLLSWLYSFFLFKLLLGNGYQFDTFDQILQNHPMDIKVDLTLTRLFLQDEEGSLVSTHFSTRVRISSWWRILKLMALVKIVRKRVPHHFCLWWQTEH